MASDGTNEVRDGAVAIPLSGDEALVFFEFLQRFSTTEQLTIVDQAEERLLWNLCCELEKRLVAPFAPDYEDQLSSARERVRDSTD